LRALEQRARGREPEARAGQRAMLRAAPEALAGMGQLGVAQAWAVVSDDDLDPAARRDDGDVHAGARRERAGVVEQDVERVLDRLGRAAGAGMCGSIEAHYAAGRVERRPPYRESLRRQRHDVHVELLGRRRLSARELQ